MYLVLNSRGEVETEIDSDDLADVETAAEAVYPKHTTLFSVDNPDAEEERIDNPKIITPEFAMERSGLPWRPKARRPGVGNQYGVGITMREVLSRYPDTASGLTAAWEALLEYFPNTPDQNGFKQWASSPAKFAQSMLKSNAKTEKALPGVGVSIPPSYAVGINILPAFAAKHKSAEDPTKAAAEYYAKKGAADLPINFTRLPLVAPQLAGHNNGERRNLNNCVGSSPECRRTCLAYTGQNAAVAYNEYSKLFMTRAMFFEPLAFGRMLLEAVGKHVNYCRNGAVLVDGGPKVKLAPYVRLNVYSDIPWELFFPEFFDFCAATYPDLWFYDYTKVPGRGALPKPNYDLTFSYSGTNLDDVKKALKDKQRVAVVFLRRTAKGSQKPDPKTGKISYVPAEPITDITFLGGRSKQAGVFEGYPVIDGDTYDMRPKDPRPVIVGLRYKIPLKLEIEQEIVLANGTKLRGKVVGKTADGEVQIRPAGSKKITLFQPEQVRSVADDFVLVPPSHNSKFLVKAKAYKNQWIFGVNPSQTNVRLSSELNENDGLSAAQ